MPVPWTRDAWMWITRQAVAIERRQAAEEGRDLATVEAEFDALGAEALDDDLALQPRARALLERVQSLPFRPDAPHAEPNDPAGIRAARPGAGPDVAPPELTDEALHDRLYGAWLGRCCGCLAGKPVEGRRRASMERILRAQDRWPLADYWQMAVDPAVAREENWFADRPEGAPPPTVVEGIEAMPEDDDTNYTAVGYAILRKHGADFTPANVAQFWLRHLPFLHVCTAERVAYQNLATMVPPPAPDGTVDGPFSSATWCNPYREWIGAQIRADFFGWAAPGDPQRAAEWAWRDAAISHVRNGLYGEMWVAAMLAAAWVLDDPREIVRAGLAQIPARCRLAEELEQVLAWHQEGGRYEEVLDAVHARWDEADRHDWCHTISNAAIVAVGLLWGDLDWERSVCRAVTCAFDTDCNGATVGSIVGLVLGAGRMPSKWISPIRDTLRTGIHGMTELKVSEVAEASCGLVRSLQGGQG